MLTSVLALANYGVLSFAGHVKPKVCHTSVTSDPCKNIPSSLRFFLLYLMIIVDVVNKAKSFQIEDGFLL